MVTLSLILYELFPLEIYASQKPCLFYNLKTLLSYIHETLLKYQSAWDDMQSARMVILPFILFELFSLERCASQKPCPLYNLKTA